MKVNKGSSYISRMGSKGEITCICILCENLIGFSNGGLHNFRTHMEYEHEVMSLKQELVLAITFLQENERKELINKVMPRIQDFFEKGKSNAGDIFFENIAKEGNNEVTKVPVDELDEIQQFIDNDFSDSDDDEFSSVEVSVKQTQSPFEIEEITIGDTDSEEDEDSNIEKDNDKDIIR